MKIESMTVSVSDIDVKAVDIDYVSNLVTVRYVKRYSDPAIIAAIESYTVPVADVACLKDVAAWADNAVLTLTNAVKAKA